jgi:hypothetical protein
MAYYEPTKDIIVGAKEGSLLYRHEQGHQKWWKAGIENQMQMYQFLLMIMGIGLLGFLSKSVFIATICLIPITLTLISELHAWWYAFFVKQKDSEPESHSEQQLREMMERKFPQLKQEDSELNKTAKSFNKEKAN